VNSEKYIGLDVHQTMTQGDCIPVSSAIRLASGCPQMQFAGSLDDGHSFISSLHLRDSLLRVRWRADRVSAGGRSHPEALCVCSLACEIVRPG
jgi:hypothetical protein